MVETILPKLHTIPPKIHFVWVGNPIPRQQADVVLKWSLQNPGYTVHLWTDRPRENARALGQYWEKHPPRVLRISEPLTEALPGRHSNYRYTNDTYQVRQVVRLHDVKLLIEALGAELAGRAAQEFYHGNYGGISDILRIAVLKKEGGIYLDTDSDPATPLPRPLKAKDAILLGGFDGGGGVTLCNAVIAAPQGHAYLDEIQASITAAYDVWTAERKLPRAEGAPRFTRLIDQQRQGVDAARSALKEATPAEQRAKRQDLQFQMQSLTLLTAGPTRIELWLYQHVTAAIGKPATSVDDFLKRARIDPASLNHLQLGGEASNVMQQYSTMVVKPLLREPWVLNTYRFPKKYVTIRSDASWIK